MSLNIGINQRLSPYLRDYFFSGSHMNPLVVCYYFQMKIIDFPKLILFPIFSPSNIVGEHNFKQAFMIKLSFLSIHPPHILNLKSKYLTGSGKIKTTLTPKPLLLSSKRQKKEPIIFYNERSCKITRENVTVCTSFML